MKQILTNGVLCLAMALTLGCSKTPISEEEILTTGKSGKTEVKAAGNPVEAAYTSQCTNGQTIVVGASYKLNNNIWGAGTNGAGSQCVWYESSNGQWGVNAAHTSGTGQNIKGYPALVRGWIWYNSAGSIWASASDTTFPVQMSHLQSFFSNWTMTVPTNGEKYNSSYDIWLDTQSNPNLKAQYEVMIWLNYKGPAYNGSDFLPIGTKVGTNVTIGGHVWDIWTGNNGTNNVYTFRRTTNTSSVNNLNIGALLLHAQNAGFIQSSYYLLGVQAGWEIVSGGAFTTTSYTTTIVKN
jgi:hypothetical protein